MSVNVCLLVSLSVLCSVSAFLVYYVYYIRGYENENFVTISLMRTSLAWVNIVESHCASLSSWPGVISRFAIASEMFSGSRVEVIIVNVVTIGYYTCQ